MKPETLRGLHAEWRKLSPSLDSELPERDLRLAWTNAQLQAMYAKKGGRFITIQGRKVFVKCDSKMVNSWNSLTEGEAKRLIQIMREQSGDGSAYRALLIARLASDFWGSNWNDFLRADLQRRFRTPDPQSLTPAQAHAEIEELVSRIARRDGVDAEDVRGRFSPQRRRGTEKKD